MGLLPAVLVFYFFSLPLPLCKHVSVSVFSFKPHSFTVTAGSPGLSLSALGLVSHYNPGPVVSFSLLVLGHCLVESPARQRDL